MNIDNSTKLNNPYSPLIAIDQQDCLVGREKDINDFMNVLRSQKTRVMILHGETGVGKSSFLHAGLLSKFESLNMDSRKFDILEFNEKKIISCGINPVEDISCAIFHSKWNKNFMKINKKSIEPDDEINFDKLVKSFKSKESLMQLFLTKEGISNFFRIFSLYTPCTKILIIDHAEKIFTHLCEDDIKSLLDGIKSFSIEDSDAKIILSIRTEFVGQLKYKMYDFLFPNRTRDIYLTDIDQHLIEVIEKPCKKIPFKFENGIPEKIAKTIIGKKRKSISVLPILHIILYGAFKKMVERIIKEGGEMIITNNDVGDKNEDYIGIISSFVKEEIGDVCRNEGLVFQEDNFFSILNELVTISSQGPISKIIKEDESNLKGKIEKIRNSRDVDNNADIIDLLSKKRILTYSSPYIELSHDLFAEAIVFLMDKSEQLEKTGLTDVFENKRDPGIEKSMANILSEFRENRTRVGQLMLASVVGKQFFHKNDKLYNEMNSLLETLKKEGVIKPIVKVIIAKPYSKLFLCRAESELPDESIKYSHNGIHPHALDWKEDRIFIDSLITIGRLQFLTERYKNIIDVRLSDFMPLSILSSGDHAIFNPYTFAADGKVNEKESWCGALPIYHHKNKKSYQIELKNHFNYLWSKGITLDEFDCFLQEKDVYLSHKIEFFNRKQKI